MFDEYDADESRIRAKVNMFVATRVPLSEAIEVGKLLDLHGYRAAFDRVLEIAQADAVMNPGEPKDDPSIRELFGGPHWRTHVARYFGFR